MTDGRARRFLVASASCIADSKWAMVAEMPHTIGIGGRAFVPLTSRRTMVCLSDVALVLKPRCASSSTRYRVRSSAAIVLASVSQIVQPCMSGADAARPGMCSCPSGAVSTCPRVSSELLVSFWVFRKYTLPGSRRGLANGGSMCTRFEYVNFSEACLKPVERLLVQARVVGEPEHDRTRVRRRSRTSSLPQNSASIAAAAMTVLPAPVVAVSENDEISRLSGFLKFSRARLRLARTSSTASFLVVLQGELHSDPRPDSISKLRRYAS